MARIESIALGGFYPTPTHLLPLIRSRLHLVPPPAKPMYGSTREHRIAMLDPCAGRGEAILALAEGLSKDQADLYCAEMEPTRGLACKEAVRALDWNNERRCVLGDAFHVRFEGDGVGLLYLNPPYDQDREFGRLEARWLARFTQALAVGGVLVLVVPYYALAACAPILATHYERLSCGRFPGTDFDAFKQVVLYAVRGSAQLAPAPAILAQVEAWAREAPPELGDGEAYAPPFRGPHTCDALSLWQLEAVDYVGLFGRYRPWHTTDRAGALQPMTEIIPEGPIVECMRHVYPVCTAPRPAHIAAGIAAGVFNGMRLRPNPEAGDAPELLVKGVFDREFKTVEEKFNKDGDKTGEVQVQQPKLVTTVLDLRARTFHRLAEGAAATGSREPATMTAGDLLATYGGSLMTGLRAQCPALYEPRRDGGAPVWSAPTRTPFRAQAHAVRALVKLLEQPDESAVLLGEIGCGKSTVSLLAARTRGAERVLVTCPPHLLDSWKNEAAKVAPDMRTIVLETVEDLDRLPETPLLAILSREAAKLSHGVAGVDVAGACPKCGGPLPHVDLAKKRAHCEHVRHEPADAIARAARSLAYHLMRFSPACAESYGLDGRFDRVRAERQKTRGWEAPPAGMFAEAIAAMVGGEAWSPGHRAAVLWLAHALGQPEWTAMLVASLLDRANHWDARAFAQELALLVADRPEIVAVFDRDTGYVGQEFRRESALLDEGRAVALKDVGDLVRKDGSLVLRGRASGSFAAFYEALTAMHPRGRWRKSPPCGEPLYQAIPSPRRVSLAKHIVRYYASTFDFLIVDECHEYATEGSAQERAAHRLVGLRLPTILMTGSVMNGYAESLFTNMWSISSAFRREFGRDDKSAFVDRFGYRKRFVGEATSREVRERGAQSDRVELVERTLGSAPGVLPLFVLRHLLPVSVTLQKADLAVDLPKCTQTAHPLEPDPELGRRYKALVGKLVDRIRSDRFVEGMAGKLFGALAEIPSYLDRATVDTGNGDDGTYAVRYPEACGGSVVAAFEGLPASTVLPKERWMLDLVRAELAEGRSVMVFGWHVSLLPRLSRLLEEHLGEKAPVLFADKVGAGKRQAWIEKEILKKGRRLLVTNPIAIQTGLNNLVHFSSEVWMQNPACNPLAYRQSIGRIDRIGQTRETRVHFPVYTGTLQQALHELLLRKVAISTATDGLDPEAALAAAGMAGQDQLAGLSIGKQLWSMIEEEERVPFDAAAE